MNKYAASVWVWVTVTMLFLPADAKPILAAMIGTEALAEAARADQVRKNLEQRLATDRVRTRLLSWGITPLAAQTCINSLSDAEIIRIANQLEILAAGGSGGPWGIVGIALVVTFLVLLITDLLGYTDFFNIR
jgi:hypothetical protein